MVDYTTFSFEDSSLNENTLTLLQLTRTKAFKDMREFFFGSLSPKQLNTIVQDLWGGGLSSDERSYIAGMAAMYVIPRDDELLAGK
jgi:hypothetical protein